MPTLKDVAKKAGVSYGTVSEVLNLGKADRYSKETVKKVIDTAKQLNYQPHYFAQSLKKQKTKVIGVTTGGQNFLRTFNNPYAADIFTGFGHSLIRTDYKLIFHNFREHLGLQDIEEFASSRIVDGMIYLLYSRYATPEEWNPIIAVFERLGIPLVLVHSRALQIPCHNVGLDTVKAGYLGTTHLLEHGHKTVTLISAENPSGHVTDLEAGYAQALQEHSGEESIVRAENVGAEYAYSLAREIARTSPMPRALFCTDDSLAYGLLAGFRELGVKVPEDIALVGFGDEVNQNFSPTDLTSVKQPAAEKGQLAMDILMELIAGPDKIKKPKSVIMEPTLTVRKSCGCNSKGIVH